MALYRSISWLPALALAGAVALTAPALANTSSTAAQGTSAQGTTAGTTAGGTTSGPAVGTPVAGTMPATPHQAEVLKNNGEMATAEKTPANSAMDAKHVHGEKGAESGAAPKTK